MAETVYILCALTTLGCAVLLFRGYRQTRTRLLFWSSICFAGLALNNVLLLIDLVLLPTEIDLAIPRGVMALASLLVFVWGLIGVDRGGSP
jgi:Family of unknown function (DUF5985)